MENLVQRVNELYYDLEFSQYEKRHPAIFIMEKERWKNIAKSYIYLGHPLKIIDIGTGTGFLPLTIGTFLKKEDLFVCLDISKEILNIAKMNIKNSNFKCRFEFVKLNNQTPFKLPFDSNYANIITMNSLLHHIFDTNNFLIEVNRVLKKNGLLIIGHEPNKYFYESKLLMMNYLIIKNIIHPRYTIKRLFRRLIKKKNGHDKLNLRKKKIAQKINEVLLKEKIIKKPLSFNFINRIKDIKALVGFKPDKLHKNFRILKLGTYNYLFSVSEEVYNKPFFKFFENVLGKLFPKKGSKFTVVLKKIND